MPLTFLVPLIIVGITAVLLTVHFFGGTKDVELTEQAIRTRFTEDFPHLEIIAVHISPNAKSAWLALKDPSIIGFIQPFGSGIIVRTISAKEIVETEFEQHRTTLHLNDFAMRTVVIDGKPQELRAVLAAMEKTT